MTRDEYLIAAKKAIPVICRGITYQRVSAITVRFAEEQERQGNHMPEKWIELELEDIGGNSITHASPRDVEPADREMLEKAHPEDFAEKKKRQEREQVYEEIVGYLNEELGTSYRAQSKNTRRLIDARLAEGHTPEEFRQVIRTKKREWAGTEMAKYLRPDTLFCGKFDGYLNENAVRELKGKQEEASSFDTDEFFAAAFARTYGTTERME